MSEVTREEFESLQKIVYDLKKERDDLQEERKRNEKKLEQLNELMNEGFSMYGKMYHKVPRVNNEK